MMINERQEHEQDFKQKAVASRLLGAIPGSLPKRWGSVPDYYIDDRKSTMGMKRIVFHVKESQK